MENPQLKNRMRQSTIDRLNILADEKKTTVENVIIGALNYETDRKSEAAEAQQIFGRRIERLEKSFVDMRGEIESLVAVLSENFQQNNQAAETSPSAFSSKNMAWIMDRLIYLDVVAKAHIKQTGSVVLTNIIDTEYKRRRDAVSSKGNSEPVSPDGGAE